MHRMEGGTCFISGQASTIVGTTRPSQSWPCPSCPSLPIPHVYKAPSMALMSWVDAHAVVTMIGMVYVQAMSELVWL